jgi:hypothetical protein
MGTSSPGAMTQFRRMTSKSLRVFTSPAAVLAPAPALALAPKREGDLDGG